MSTNYQTFLSILGPSRFAPVVKSNAYGHGLDIVFKCIQDFSPQTLCVNYASEADQLRKLGFRGSILIVGPLDQDEMAHAAEVDADIVMCSFEQFHDWKTLQQKPKLHVKFDTGMRRQGFLKSEWPQLLKEIKPYRPSIKALCTHFACVEDVLEQDFANSQLSELNQAYEIFQKENFSVYRHAAASASTLILPDSRLDLGRVGISLYGFWPSAETRLSYLKQNDRICDLKPALTWKTKISHVKTIEAGDYVGYGMAFRAQKNMKIGVLPVGYNEGYPRLVGEHQSYVIVAGKRAPIIGRICMNMAMIDLSNIETAKVHDPVILLGKDNSGSDEEIPAELFAKWSGTIHYEAVTRLNANIPRQVVNAPTS